MTVEAASVTRFMQLFSGYPHAYGTGAGGWVKQPPKVHDFQDHLAGRGRGIGIGPLREDGTCSFAAIDLDEPNFDLARDFMKLLPGVSWLERSRSGNAHVLVFFSAPIEAWVVRGIMREVLAAIGRRDVEVFPKADHLLPGMFGNYLNLPYHGDERPAITWHDGVFHYKTLRSFSLMEFTMLAMWNRNDPDEWRKRAAWLGVPSPVERETERRDFGTSPHLHKCAEYIIENRDTNPVTEGHRAVVYFNLAKQLANWSEIDDEEALALMTLVNDSSPDPVTTAELQRMLQNAYRRGYTSTGCDDPLFEPWAHPDCPIAHPKGH